MFEEFLAHRDSNAPLRLPLELPFPRAADRKGWDRVRPEDREAVLRLAGEVSAQPYPVILATDFMAFARTGDRQVFEKPYFFRRRKLILSVLSYCLTLDTKALDDAADGLWLIMEESSWVLSAHNIDSHPGSPTAMQKPLPDRRSPVIDLFSAQTGMILALTLFLIRPELDAISPIICRRVQDELEERLLTPFEVRDDNWWMGFLRHDLNNWTPWIVSSLLIASGLVLRDECRMAGILDRALRMTDRWIQCVPEDGGCDEGVGYWNMAGGALLDIIEVTESLTGGALRLGGDRKLKAMLSFPYRMWMGGGYFANFADCDARPYLCGERLMAAGRYVGDDALYAFGATRVGSAVQDVSDTPQFYRFLRRLFMEDPGEAAAEPPRDTRLENLEVRGALRAGMGLYAKGGTNGENHNHNDVGSFILFCDGEPVVVDIGNITYSAKTFSPSRYEIFNTRSAYHSVPLPSETEQAPGTQYCARVLEDDGALFRLDLKGAYPEAAGLERLERAWEISPEGTVTLWDDVDFAGPSSFSEVLILRHEPERTEDGFLLGAGVQLTVGSIGGWTACVEPIPVTDPRLEKSYPGTLYRLTLTWNRLLSMRLSLTFSRL